MLTELVPELRAQRTDSLSAVRFPLLRHVVYLGTDGEPGGIAWTDLLARGDTVNVSELRAREAANCSSTGPVNIQYTSGTTGSPKGATLSHHNILNNGYFVGEALHLTPDDRLCVPVPFYHCFGCVMGNLGGAHARQLRRRSRRVVRARGDAARHRGRTVHLHLRRADDVHRGARTCEFSELSARHAADGHHGGRLVSDRSHAPGDGPDARAGDHDLLRHDRNLPGVVPVRRRRPGRTSRLDRRIDSSRISNARSWIRKPARSSPRGTSGELCTRGYSVMLGYWEDGAATGAAIDAARWMHTGDLAVMRDDGYVNIVGRIKDLIIRGGDNVYPREVEEFLYSAPQDQRRADHRCAGREIRRGDLRVDPPARRRSGDRQTRSATICRGQIATYKIPRYVQLHAGISDDGDGQDSEVQDARNLYRGTGPGRCAGHSDGVK